MHDHAAEGNDFFKCDFCRKPWAEDRPMVEGHQGSLVCASCLTVAYLHVHAGPKGDGDDAESPAGPVCRMCLEARAGSRWESPLDPAAVICRRCVRQSAVTLERDPDYGWKRPGGGGAGEAGDAEGEDEDDRA